MLRRLDFVCARAGLVNIVFQPLCRALRLPLPGPPLLVTPFVVKLLDFAVREVAGLGLCLVLLARHSSRQALERQVRHMPSPSSQTMAVTAAVEVACPPWRHFAYVMPAADMACVGMLSARLPIAVFALSKKSVMLQFRILR